jgi:hypothetical protein
MLYFTSVFFATVQANQSTNAFLYAWMENSMKFVRMVMRKEN